MTSLLSDPKMHANYHLSTPLIDVMQIIRIVSK